MNLSPSQLSVFQRMKLLGTPMLERQPGGFWTIGGKPHAEWYASTPTVKALERLGLLRPVDWGYDSQGSFPVAYCPTPAGFAYLKGLGL